MLGTADRIVVMKEQTTIVSDGRNDEAVKARIKTIRKDAETSDSAVSFCGFFFCSLGESWVPLLALYGAHGTLFCLTMDFAVE